MKMSAVMTRREIKNMPTKVKSSSLYARLWFPPITHEKEKKVLFNQEAKTHANRR